jgi:hypothetical protein
MFLLDMLVFMGAATPNPSIPFRQPAHQEQHIDEYALMENADHQEWLSQLSADKKDKEGSKSL